MKRLSGQPDWLGGVDHGGELPHMRNVECRPRLPVQIERGALRFQRILRPIRGKQDGP